MDGTESAVVPTKERQGMLTATRCYDRHGWVLSQDLWRERAPAGTLMWTSGLQNSEDTYICCFKPPRL